MSQVRKDMSNFNDNSSLDDEVFTHWPSDWPGRKLVDLDNVGDLGTWLDGEMPAPSDVILDPAEDHQVAEGLAEAYIATAINLSVPLPIEFGGTEEEMFADVVADFVGFIREWRRRTLADQTIVPGSGVKAKAS